jgi:hypothetical protein
MPSAEGPKNVAYALLVVSTYVSLKPPVSVGSMALQLSGGARAHARVCARPRRSSRLARSAGEREETYGEESGDDSHGFERVPGASCILVG